MLGAPTRPLPVGGGPGEATDRVGNIGVQNLGVEWLKETMFVVDLIARALFFNGSANVPLYIRKGV